MDNAGKRILWGWLPVLIWLIFITLESSNAFSSAHTGSFLYGIVTALFGQIDAIRFEMFHALLRKTGHFVGYAVLSLLFFRALRQTFASAAASIFANRRWALISVGLTMFVAGLDELHQSFIPSRTGALRDVILDTLGALCMQISVVAILQLRDRRSTQTASVAE